MSLNLDRTAWKRVALGDVARASKERCEPGAGSIQRYIAGEHMDTDDLKIRRWGDVGDGYLGPAFHRAFHPGQVLYGSRRTYLRKVAVAEFDGVCANTTFVIESRDSSALLQEFLPFVMTSESFHAFAIAESKGSVNPYVNWSDLARFEFHVPPPDEQGRIADLLWASERHRESVLRRTEALRVLREVMVEDQLTAAAEDTHVALRSLVRTGTSITYGIVQAGPEVGSGVPYIRVSDMTNGTLSAAGMKRTAPEIAARFSRSRVETGDLVVALRGRTGLTLRVPPELDGANLTQGTARVAIDSDKIDPDYVQAVMNSRWMATFVDRHAKGSTFTELTLAALQAVPIPRLGDGPERQLVSDLEQIEVAVSASVDELAACDALRAAVSQSIFGNAL